MVHLLELPVLCGYSLVRFVFNDKIAILGLTCILIILLEIEYIRLEYKLKIPKVIDIWRKHERDNIAGNIFFIAATIICFAAYDYEIALLALLMTVFGDLASALIGSKFGKFRIYKSKTLEGFLSGLIVNSIVGFFIFPTLPILAFSMAIIAAVVELYTGKLDDNLTVPLAAGFTGTILCLFLQINVVDYLNPVLQELIKSIH